MQNEDRNRWKKPLLALTSILGVTAVVTLAGWTVNTYLKGTFQTAQYSAFQASLDGGTTWLTYDKTATVNGGAAGSLVFTAPTGGISASTPAYIPFELRSGANTTANVMVSMKGAATGTAPNDGTGVLFDVVTLAAGTTTCNATTIAAGTVVGSGVTVNPSVATTNKITLTPGGVSAGPVVNLCMKVYTDANAVENTTHNIEWTLTGTP